MKRIKLINRIIYYIILLGFLLFIASGFIFSSVDNKAPAQDRTRITVHPEDTRYSGDGRIEYYLKLNSSAGDNMALAFVSRHQEVEVYAGGSLIYYIKSHKSVYGSTTGTNYTIVNIPPYTTDIVVRLTNVYKGSKIRETTFEYGDETGIVKELISESLIPAALSSFIIMVGVAMVVLWIACRKRIAQTQALLYFGVFAQLIGAWALNETNLATLLISDRKIGSLIGYMLLMLMPIPFVQAEKNFFQIIKSHISNTFCAIFMITDIVLLVCHVTGICEFRNSVYVIHLMLVMSMIYFCAVVIKRIQDKGFDRKVRANIVGAVALGVSMAVDLIAYYKGMQQTDVLGKLGMLIFIVVIGYESISEAFEKIKEGQKADFYKEMAITDTMTGLYNRAAFDEWENETSDYEGYAIATFDLNNLKWCNDNLGHAAGDAYIQAAARIIKDIFGRHGKCYRIGGDEFCAVINQKERHFDIGRHVRQLRELEEQAEMELEITGLNVQIACGYAEYDIKTDKDFEDTRSRSDKRMYESKRKLKSE
ncbi:MAG: GGDEF domain-containing protein [Eubacteriales bacterium]|nr:GGDEF domain-containing protein [Eubacteriales bacterium]